MMRIMKGARRSAAHLDPAVGRCVQVDLRNHEFRPTSEYERGQVAVAGHQTLAAQLGAAFAQLFDRSHTN